jgi:hypothetical protein
LPDGKSPKPGNFGRVLQWKLLAYFIAIWYILLPFGLFYCHLVYFIAIWSILLPFGIFCGDLVYFVAIWCILWQFGKFYGKNLAVLVGT